MKPQWIKGVGWRRSVNDDALPGPDAADSSLKKKFRVSIVVAGAES
jgi:hypothetical protein